MEHFIDFPHLFIRNFKLRRGRGGGYLATFYTAGFRTVIQPSTLLYTILAEQGTPFVCVKLPLKNVASSTCLLIVSLLVILSGIGTTIRCVGSKYFN